MATEMATLQAIFDGKGFIVTDRSGNLKAPPSVDLPLLPYKKPDHLTSLSFFLLFLVTAMLLGGCSNKQTAVLPADTIQTNKENNGVSPTGWPTKTWRTSSPEEQGMDAQLLADMLEKVQKESIDLHSLLIVRHGVIVSETYFGGYDQNTRHPVWSCTKSVMSTLIGMAIDRGLIQGIDQKVLELFPGETFANMDAAKEAMTLDNVLTMTTGLSWTEKAIDEMYGEPDWAKYVLDLPLIRPPGETFNYCSGCSHVLSVIFERRVGMNAEVFAKENVFTPLGIKNYTWESNREGSSIGGWGLEMTPRDMAKLGYLHLHNGVWADQQIVPQEWVKNATQKRVSVSDGVGYGYQWWVYPTAYAALGKNGQTIYILPDLDLIVVTTAYLPNHDQIFQLINQYIVPAIK
jgi:CubicO group peptidase (beta-lactamase class C family)